LFNNQENDETDFCESYKSQVLGKDTEEPPTSFFSTLIKLLTIIILLALISGLSFYGYNYFISTQKSTNTLPLPPVSIQVSEDDLVVTHADEATDEEKQNELNTSEETIKDEKEKSTEQNESTKEISLEVPSGTPAVKYLEELADLSKEVDKEKK